LYRSHNGSLEGDTGGRERIFHQFLKKDFLKDFGRSPVSNLIAGTERVRLLCRQSICYEQRNQPNYDGLERRAADGARGL
jgi:hypothetical protein